METMQTLLDFGGLQNRNRFVERFRIQVQQERKCNRLEVANPVRAFKGHPAEDAAAPRLFAEPLGKQWGEFLQFVDIVWLTDQREGEVADLGEVAVINLQAFDRFETSRQKVENFGIQFHPGHENTDRKGRNDGDGQPDHGSSSGNEVGNGGMECHGKWATADDARVSTGAGQNRKVKVSPA